MKLLKDGELIDMPKDHPVYLLLKTIKEDIKKNNQDLSKNTKVV